MMKAAISINHLTKTYRGSKKPALDSLSLRVAPGEVYGFLGANGAGKSTTIRLLLNFIQPSQGSATILENDVVKDSVKIRRHVGYLSGDVALHHKVTGSRLLSYLASLSGDVDKEYFDTLVKRFEAQLDVPIKTLSKGNRQKVGIIQAFMHQPDVIILDEPTSGLDPLMQEAFYETVREAKNRGAAVFLSSHNLTEAQTLCDRIGIIRHGKLIHEQAIGSGTSLTSPRFTVRLKNKRDMELLKRSPAISIVSSDEQSLVVSPKHSLRQLFVLLSRFEIDEFTSQGLNLEDEFMEYYGDES